VGGGQGACTTRGIVLLGWVSLLDGLLGKTEKQKEKKKVENLKQFVVLLLPFPMCHV
jgi:hypothetical protein